MRIGAGLALKNADFPSVDGDYRVTSNCYDTVEIKALCMVGRRTGLITKYISL
ncbi:MAG TPA: hypothetical protein VG075_15560 [Candidatus Acidoferrum sp.]|jgi:hypothetical protein|nr:hypothetical protein [Candidatus Acidoferrum sp.]